MAGDDVVEAWEEVRPDGRAPLLVLDSLARFLDEHALGSGEIAAEAIGDGHSNVTYLLERGGLELVLRRPPRPPLPPSAHDVLREARLLTALAPTAIPVPRVLATCAREEVIGSPFYLMERVAGHVVGSEIPRELDTPLDRRTMGEQLIDVLVDLRELDWRAIGLEGFGRESGYLERQLRRFAGLWERNRTRELPLIEETHRRLAGQAPTQAATAIVHGDFRLGNVILAVEAPARIVSVLDWEMATIGDPLADLGYLLALWVQPGDPSLGAFEQTGLTRLAGFASRDQLIARYERRAAVAVDDVRWYQALALWKLAVLMEGNLRRAREGSTDDPFLGSFEEGVVQLAERALELTRA